MSQDVSEARPLARHRSSTTGDLGTSVLRSKIRTLNSVAMSSLGNLFSGRSSSRSSAYMRHSEEDNAYRELGSRVYTRPDCELGEIQTSDIDESQDDSSVGQYCNLRDLDYCAVKALGRLSISPDPGVKHATTADGDEEYSFVQDHIVTSPSVCTTPIFPEVRRMFNSLSRAAKEKSMLGQSGCGSDTQQSISSLGSRSANPDTPPLTPESVVVSLPSPALSLDPFDSSLGLDEFCIFDPDINPNHDARLISRLQEIKDGKKPAKAEPVLDDAFGAERRGSETPVTPSDQREWYGLEYTLQMSSCERKPSIEYAQPATIGEHSRSHESWAAIHRDTIHPMFEDEGYAQWKTWHRFLDRQDETRRHHRGGLFRIQSRELSRLYVDELRTRETMYWQKEVYGVVARDVKEKLQYLANKRPDPFFPARKHNLAWFLKRSRSIGSIRELKEEEYDY